MQELVFSCLYRVHSRYTRMAGFGRREIEYMQALCIYNRYIDCYSVVLAYCHADSKIAIQHKKRCRAFIWNKSNKIKYCDIYHICFFLKKLIEPLFPVLRIVWSSSNLHSLLTIEPRSSYPYYKVTYYIKWGTPSWTDSRMGPTRLSKY